VRSHDRAERLDAPRWRWPRVRRSGLLRGGAATALLLLAAGVLYAEPSPPPASRPGSCTPAALPDTPPAGMVGFPLRLAGAAALAVVHAGHRVDVLAPADGGGPAAVVAANLRVLRVVGGETGDGVLYLAARPEQASALAGIAPDVPVSVTVRAP
jgi:hypothetical protein